MMGDIDIGGMLRFGPQSSGNLRLTQNMTGLEDGLALIRGAPRIKIGGLLEHYQDNMFNPTFGARHLHFRRLQAISARTGRCASSALPPEAQMDRYWRFTPAGVYAQDVSSGAPPDAEFGLRYEYTTVPQEKYGRDAALLHLEDRSTIGNDLQESDYKNFSPRAGSPGIFSATGRTSLRGGYGLYFNTNNQQNLIVTVTNPPGRRGR